MKIFFSRKFLLFLLAFLILGLDAKVKLWAIETLSPWKEKIVFHNFLGIDFSLRYVKNTGAAWGLFAAYSQWLLMFRVVLVAALIVYLCFFNRRKNWEIPLVLVIAGALGNILDMFRFGHVVDLFHFVFWGFDFAVFNVADMAVTLGIAWLFLLKEPCVRVF